jgi:DNA excision repair protein ERCC-4
LREAVDGCPETENTGVGAGGMTDTPDRIHWVIADDRERSSAVFQRLLDRSDVVLRVEHLPVGDYWIDNRLLVERKTLTDLAHSILTGRLFQQAGKLAAHQPPGIVILEGVASDLDGSGVRRETFQGALVTLGVVFGLPVLRARDAAETVWLMLTAAGQVRRAIRGALPRTGKRPQGKRKLQLELLQGLPGVGALRAAQLLDTFGTVAGVLAADLEALRAVPGIGRRTAAAIRWAVSEPQSGWPDGEPAGRTGDDA